MTVTLTIEEGVATVLLDDPKSRNAMSVPQMSDLADAVAAAGRDRVRSLLLGATGSAFCAGADITLLQSALEGDTATILGELVDAVSNACAALRSMRCPTIAAVEGPAVGAGMALALAADLRVVATSTRFIPGFLGIGATPDSGASYALVRAIGQARATSFVLRNRPIDAQTILSWGLADEIAEDGGTVAAARSLADQLGRLPADALLGTRQLFDVSPTNTLVEQLSAEKAMIATMWPTADYREGIRAFLERRPPQFGEA